MDTGVLNFEEGQWIRQQIPLSSFIHTSNPGADLTNISYFRIYLLSPNIESLVGQEALVKICNIRLINTAEGSDTGDRVGDGSFLADAPVWTPVTFGSEYAAYSDPLVAGYNMKAYAEAHAAQFGYTAGDANFDWAPVFKTLMDGLDHVGGGALFIPAGEYSFYSPVTLPRGVQVYGEWCSPETDHTVRGTILKVYCGKNDAGGSAFINMSTHTQISNLSIWYPEQDAQNIKTYPATVFTNDYTFVKNVTLVNSYFGIQQNSSANCPNVMKRVRHAAVQGLGYRYGYRHCPY